MKITIKYNVPIGGFRAVERLETIYAEKTWSVSGTDLLYYRNGFRTGSIAKSEIVSIEN